jgi:hypothetical protein
MERHGLPDDQFARIEDLVAGCAGKVAEIASGQASFVDAVIGKFRVGALA